MNELVQLRTVAASEHASRGSRATRRGWMVAGTLGVLLVLGGCVTTPTAPAVMVLPGQYKPFDQFRLDDIDCRNYANAAIGGQVQAAQDSAAATALGSAILGAAAGAAIGSISGQAGQGAAIGAGMGAIFGGAASAGQGNASSYDLQRRYDGAYMQCMYTRGNQIPAPVSSPPVTRYPAPPASSAPAQYPPPTSSAAPASYPPPVQYPPPASVPRQQ